MRYARQPSKSSPLSQKPRRKPGSKRKAPPVRKVALAEVKNDLSRYLRLAERQEIVITRHGRAAGLLVGFESDEDWFEYRLEHHPEFLRRIAAAREALRQGRGISLEDIAE